MLRKISVQNSLLRHRQTVRLNAERGGGKKKGEKALINIPYSRLLTDPTKTFLIEW